MDAVRRPAVAGTFYPGTADVLAGMVDCLLRAAAADQPPQPGGTCTWAYQVPHAGYVYSGPVAARAYGEIAAAAGAGTTRFGRVVILGPAHRVAVDGIATSGAGAFGTPLGRAEVDLEAQSALDALPFVTEAPEVHRDEHAIEVQLPFLQRVLPGVPVVPLAVGRATPEQVSAVIEALAPDPSTLVLVSSDLSHYLPYHRARAVDEAALARISALDVPVTHEQACGATPLNGLLHLARKRGLRPHVLCACNSGDTAGERRRVVGYAAVAFRDHGRQPAAGPEHPEEASSGSGP